MQELIGYDSRTGTSCPRVPAINIIRREVDDTHFYLVNNEYFPSVTQILDEAAPKGQQLLNWMKQNSASDIEQISQDSMAFGSKLHRMYEKLLNGEEVILEGESTKFKRHIMSFYSWFNDYKPKIIQTEAVVASTQYKYAGTLDLACKIDGELWIIDFKTSSGIYFSHELQLAAYLRAYQEMYGYGDAHMGVLRTGSKHKCGYEFKEVTRDFKDFKNVYDMYLTLHGGKIPEPPLITAYPESLKLELQFRRIK